MLPRIAVIDILHKKPKFEIVNRHFSKLACTSIPLFASRFIDNKKLENYVIMMLFIETTTFFVSYWWSDLTARQSVLNRKKSFTTMIFNGRYTLMFSGASTFHFRRVIMREHSEGSYPENVKQTPKLDQIYSQHFALIKKQRTESRAQLKEIQVSKIDICFAV
jgi:hypothetical protein